MFDLRILWDILRGKKKPPPTVEIEQVAHDQDELEPLIRNLERAAALKKWQRERRHDRR